MASFDYTGQVAPQQVHYTYQMPPQGAPEPLYETDNHDGAGYDGPATSGFATSRMVTLLGAVGSLALVVGIGIWGFKLVARDVSGVPVVRAIEGPMRIQPEKPGGTPADHQGLAVNNVAAQGTAAAPADRLMLAPRPVSLAEEDAPMGQLATTQVALNEVGENALDAFRNGSVDELVAELTDGVEPLSVIDAALPETQAVGIVQPEPLAAIDPADLVAQQPAIALLDEPGVQRSLRPRVRPARVVQASVSSSTLNEAINSAVATAASLDIDAESLPVGTRLAQLGAYDSPEIARAEWDRLNARFGDYMDGKKRVVQKASSGGRTFYRLRAMGFSGLSDARRFCSALVAEKADCIPVTTR